MIFFFLLYSLSDVNYSDWFFFFFLVTGFRVLNNLLFLGYTPLE